MTRLTDTAVSQMEAYILAAQPAIIARAGKRLPSERDNSVRDRTLAPRLFSHSVGHLRSAANFRGEVVTADDDARLVIRAVRGVLGLAERLGIDLPLAEPDHIREATGERWSEIEKYFASAEVTADNPDYNHSNEISG